MIEFKKALLVAGGALLINIGCVQAQSSDTLKMATDDEKTEAIVRRMERELSMTQGQTVQVMKLVSDRFSNLRTKGTAQLDVVNSQSRQGLAAILTKEQYARYIALRQETRKQKDQYVSQHPDYVLSPQDREMDF